MIPILIALACLCLLALVYRHARVPVRHRWRRRQARIMCNQMRGPDRNQPATLVYARLRAMDPLAFEELLLEAFEQRGNPVIRNRRYTGDGGVDGEVIVEGVRFLIQAKRYRETIRPEHVRAFAALCASRRQPGLFIHTGRTGGASRDALAAAPGVEIISGNSLLELLTGGTFALPSQRLRRPAGAGPSFPNGVNRA
ncbi:restriction system protein [Sphingomonas laterariae]|uniref:Restriction system protein n=1 Tax=Edaphosphingomonas laterariae TaxID=861865 RepID=A0A239GGP3_9SPHN|nr:restriction endonuclease [Sphingomonas laterariae]SNS68211.1 restriction system protein [Sphingomonas laterariae]